MLDYTVCTAAVSTHSISVIAGFWANTEPVSTGGPAEVGTVRAALIALVARFNSAILITTIKTVVGASSSSTTAFKTVIDIAGGGTAI
eukprot:CAMPEP_0205810996 /NCGR_PEP_ID=MMETSP0205-20121125/15158_1 /ASSEMBLY_ACC=CAM_ASM_000278 /TAXON_ID=36767 /ORGANISM="Euplotes focardii, Strain TN1" /LENGTH=87 /DNA_ID=CAMNT_0053089649 /DNA_START=2036 /DNA_END=2299 /DNA_ORIENTATION=-